MSTVTIAFIEEDGTSQEQEIVTRELLATSNLMKEQMADLPDFDDNIPMPVAQCDVVSFRHAMRFSQLMFDKSSVQAEEQLLKEKGKKTELEDWKDEFCKLLL